MVTAVNGYGSQYALSDCHVDGPEVTALSGPKAAVDIWLCHVQAKRSAWCRVQSRLVTCHDQSRLVTLCHVQSRLLTQ